MTWLRIALLAHLCLTIVTYAQRPEEVVDSISFGYDGQISADSQSPFKWSFCGENYEPQLMSDRLILTPPYPGNCKGAIWTQETVNTEEWTVDLNFRATGPGRGGGSLQLWYTKDSQISHVPKTLYTVTEFDGLLIVIDQYGGRGGSIRGYLNDGTQNYKENLAVDTLAFGRCDYPYRNLGRLSNIRIAHNSEFFQVQIDDQECFKTDKIRLPSRYYYGISAATSEDPDSFEVHKFVLSASDGPSHNSFVDHSQILDQQSTDGGWGDSDKLSDIISSSIREISGQLKEMDARMQAMDRMINSISTEIIDSKVDGQDKASTMESGLRDIDGRVRSIEQMVKKIRSEVEGRDYKETLAKIHGSLKETNTNLLNDLPASISQVVTRSSPQMGYFLSIILAFQLSMALTYVFYKRRRNSNLKKYL